MERDIPQEECDIYTAIDELLYTGRISPELADHLETREIGRFVVSLEEIEGLNQMGNYQDDN